MTIEEKKYRLYSYCSVTDCIKCKLNPNYDYNDRCNTHFSDAPDEMIEKWYMTVFPEPIIKDSGHRREFESGAVRDMAGGKGRMDLLPWAAIMEVSKHCENGAKKYGEHNVDKGLPTSSFCDSAARHLAKYLDGWTDEPHLLAATWNLLWAVQMTIKNPEMVDTPWRDENEQTH